MTSRNPIRKSRPEGERHRERFQPPPQEEQPSQPSPAVKPMLLQRRPANGETKSLFSPDESISLTLSPTRRGSIAKEKEVVPKKDQVEEQGLPGLLKNTAPKPLAAPVYVSDVESSNVTQGEKKELPVKLLDESLVFVNSLSHFLQEQSDFLVVGCIGSQGAGKSHVLSSVFGPSLHDCKRFVFPIQSQRDIEVGSHRTSGIDVYVTPERTILLDCQPVLSSSVMYKDIQADWEKKIGLEFGSSEAAAEMNSIQLISFLLCVCHVVLVVQDWILDPNLLRLIQTAEMLKPSFPPSNQDEPYVEAFPHVVFVFNRASPDDSRTARRLTISETLKRIFSKSNLKVESGITNIPSEGSLNSPVNLCFLGEEDVHSSEVIKFASSVARLRLAILSTPRHLVCYTNLSEKSWLTYAAKVWDFIKKSPLFMEYSRLLP